MDIIKKFSNQPVQPDPGIIRVLSIDLGTTNSTIAESVCLPGYPPMCRVLEITQPLHTGSFRSALIPSDVAWLSGSDTVLVGEGARRLRNSPEKLRLIWERDYFHETKNDMGLNRTYDAAPEYLNQPYKVAGYLLSFMIDAAGRGAVCPCRSVTVTVPASFQMNQRRDTLRAAQMADLSLGQDCLLEEPTAALIDFLMSDICRPVIPLQGNSLCIVFDFGGGTCDVSVIDISGRGPGDPLFLSELSVSRYHRLGGGDIDKAIVHEVLIPRLLEEDGLKPLDLTWYDKKKLLEPQLIGTAETLKIDLCRKVRGLEENGGLEAVDKKALRVKAPPVKCRLESGDLLLARPTLSLDQFETLLRPFLDTDHLYARETEYRLTQSIFSPLEDALDRIACDPEDVDFCLMTGGSVLIPQVRRAVEAYFGPDKVYCHDDPESVQTAVARGAAWNNIYKTVTGRPLIQPVMHDGINLETNDGGTYPLIEPDTPLPWPPDGSWQRLVLETPQTNRLFLEQLRIKLISSMDEQHLLNEIWTLPEAACPGDDIIMEYRLTAGKQFECRAFLRKAAGAVFDRIIENPLVNVVNPGSTRLKIEETKEKLRRQKGGTGKNREDYINLAEWHAELNQHEKAIHYLRTALKKINRPDNAILNLQGIYYRSLRDYERAEKAFREAMRANDSCDGPIFNLALTYLDAKRFDEALVAVDQGLEKNRDTGAYLALKADILNRMGEKQSAEETAGEAAEAFPSLPMLEDWSLGWFISNARFLKDQSAIEKGEAERKRRLQPVPSAPDDDTPRPVVKGDIVLFQLANAV